MRVVMGLMDCSFVLYIAIPFEHMMFGPVQISFRSLIGHSHYILAHRTSSLPV